jgi:hypothetical protein
MRMAWKLDADHACELGAPRAGRADHTARLDRAAVGHDGGDAVVFGFEIRDRGVGVKVDTETHALARIAPDERPWKDDAVVRVVARGDDAARVELGNELLHFGGIDHARGQTVLALELHRRSERLGDAVAAGHEEIAALAKPDVDAHPRRKLGATLDRLAHQANVRVGRPLRAYAAAVSPRRAAAQIRAIDDDDPIDAEAGKVVGDGEAHDAGADDDDARFVGKGAHHSGSSSSTIFARCASDTGWKGWRGVIGIVGFSPPIPTRMRETSATQVLPWHQPVPKPVWRLTLSRSE